MNSVIMIEVPREVLHAARMTPQELRRELAQREAHINTAEGHFSQLKRSIDGTHHHVSEKHLDRYLAEFDYRYTTRKIEDGTRTEDAIRRTAGKQLTYKEVAGKVKTN